MDTYWQIYRKAPVGGWMNIRYRIDSEEDIPAAVAQLAKGDYCVVKVTTEIVSEFKHNGDYCVVKVAAEIASEVKHNGAG